MSIQLLTGDCRELLKTLPDETVHCCVTSPPYFGLRDYGTAQWDGGDASCDHLGPPVRTQAGFNARYFGKEFATDKQGDEREPMGQLCGKCGARRIDSQIGLEQTPQQYVEQLVSVFREVRRVLRKDGTVFLNLGDSYMSGGPRHTGRNDTSRETPGGRGGSFRGGVRRVIACDTSGKELEGFEASDCFCQSLCDGCRAAYRIGRFHNDRSPAAMQSSSNFESSRERMELPCDRAPTSDSTGQDDRSEDAILDSRLEPSHVDGQLLASQASTISEYASQPFGSRLAASTPDGECRVCGRSLIDCAQAFADTAVCTCGTKESGLDCRRIGKDAVGVAYQDYTTASLKPKDIIGIPWRVAFALQADGWWLRQDIIWAKPNPMPESVTDRCTKAHEYIFLLTKSARYFYDADAIAEQAKPESADRYNYAFSGAKNGQDAAMPLGYTLAPKGMREQNGTRNKRSVWTVATQPFSEAHFATFPPDLIEPCIKAGCPKGGTVLDPFGGAGTTGLVADRLGRNAIMIELNPQYAEMAKIRITDDAPLFAEWKTENAAVEK